MMSRPRTQVEKCNKTSKPGKASKFKTVKTKVQI